MASGAFAADPVASTLFALALIVRASLFTWQVSVSTSRCAATMSLSRRRPLGGLFYPRTARRLALRGAGRLPVVVETAVDASDVGGLQTAAAHS
jgi:hypothetical protein